MHIKKVLDGGALYSAAVLNITLDSIRAAFAAGAANLTAISLATGYTVSSAAPHLVLNAFKNLAAVSFASGYGFKQADKLLAAASSRPAATSASTAAPAKVVAAKAPEPEPEVDVDMGDLFGY
jgi:large subunit ribosomal protein LP0